MNDRKIINILKQINLSKDAKLEVDSPILLFDSTRTDLKPEDYLSFAKIDIQSKDTRGAINALTNAKRAIDCQVDFVMRAIGYNEHDKTLKSIVKGFIARSNLGSDVKDILLKFKLLLSLNLVPIKLISKVRYLRNTIEHEYVFISIHEAEEAIELAELFIRTIQGRGFGDFSFRTDNNLNCRSLNFVFFNDKGFYRYQIGFGTDCIDANLGIEITTDSIWYGNHPI